jgi:hypothetical protein
MAIRPIPTSPFLLPLCSVCGGATRLARIEPRAADDDGHELRIFACVDCEAQQTQALVRRK